jgi:phosphotransferase system enzyme I (PtsP)
MLPMVSSLDDFIKARQMVYDCKAELEREDIPHHRKPLIGALIELPCVIEVMDELAAEADFLSIGTNDFIQYLLAADRTNDKVAEYYQPYHPAVLRSLAKIVSSAKSRNTRISVCGELAHDSQYIPFLLGIGIRNLSVYPKYLPAVQKTIGNIKLFDAKIYANRLLGQNFLTGTEGVLKQLSKKYNLNESGRFNEND